MLATLAATFPAPAERGKAFGIYGTVIGGSSGLGVLLGGVLTDYLDWRWCMYVNRRFPGHRAPQHDRRDGRGPLSPPRARRGRRPRLQRSEPRRGRLPVPGRARGLPHHSSRPALGRIP
ncbi:MFS transporter [Microtetraspora malaysiensis]|uniref:MFS transporter n=1 Tax=Microtetraspora malaysiensis TaxID=161358 RepID=UPI003D8F0AA2